MKSEWSLTNRQAAGGNSQFAFILQKSTKETYFLLETNFRTSVGNFPLYFIINLTLLVVDIFKLIFWQANMCQAS